MKQPIKKKQKKYKQYDPNGLDRGATVDTNNFEIYLTKDPYGNPPQIDQNLPIDHPANIRAAIAQKQGWVEVPISDIDINANRKYRQSIEEDLAKYGPNAKYIVDPNTRQIIPNKVFDDLQTELGFQNTSGSIQDSNTSFEVQQAQSHRNLQARDPQGLAYTAIGTGMASNPAGMTLLGILSSLDYAKTGAERSYELWKQGRYGAAVGEGVGTAAMTLTPFSKYSTFVKYAPRVGLPIAAALFAQDASAAGQVPQAPVIGDPKEFKNPSLEQNDIDLIMDDSTPWETIGNSNEAKERWNKLIEKELNRAGFTIKESTDDLGQPSLNIYGYKAHSVPEQNNESGFYGPLYWTSVGIRYSPFALKLGSMALKKYWPAVAEKLANAWNWLTSKNNFWVWYGGANAVLDTAYGATAAYQANQGTEEAPDGFDENLARYWNKLINAYIRLNSSEKNGYAVSSSFSPEQQYKDEKNIMKPGNQLFEVPDTNHYRIIRARPLDATPSVETTTTNDLSNRTINYDSLENGQ